MDHVLFVSMKTPSSVSAIRSSTAQVPGAMLRLGFKEDDEEVIVKGDEVKTEEAEFNFIIYIFFKSDRYRKTPKEQ